MPEMSGPELAEIIRAQRPGLQVLFMSGYTDDSLARFDLGGLGQRLLQKPFSAVDLTRKVREVLDSPPR